jgi:hypothetical protein
MSFLAFRAVRNPRMASISARCLSPRLAMTAENLGCLFSVNYHQHTHTHAHTTHTHTPLPPPPPSPPSTSPTRYTKRKKKKKEEELHFRIQLLCFTNMGLSLLNRGACASPPPRPACLYARKPHTTARRGQQCDWSRRTGDFTNAADRVRALRLLRHRTRGVVTDSVPGIPPTDRPELAAVLGQRSAGGVEGRL